MYDDLTNPEKREIVAEGYRYVLLKTKRGREVFTHMLGELGLMETTSGKTERELGRFDYAIRLLDIMGIPNYQNLHNLVLNMGKWPFVVPKPEVDEYGDEVDEGGSKTPRSLTEKGGS